MLKQLKNNFQLLPTPAAGLVLGISSPGFAAFTFPLVISAKGVYTIITWFESIGIDEHYLTQLQVVALFELLIATAVVVWVSACYLKCLIGKLNATNTEITAL